MKLGQTIFAFTVAFLFSTAVLAADDTLQSTTTSAKNSPDGTEVTITGTVEDFDSRHPFTLRDGGGTIAVNLTEAKPIVLHNGEKVTITGDVNKGLLGAELSATDITIDTAANQ